MTKYNFILLSGDKETFLSKLQSVGVIDITRSVKPIDTQSEQLSTQAEQLRKALLQLKSVTPAQRATQSHQDYAGEVADTIAQIETLQSHLIQLHRELDEIMPWGRFDVRSFDKLRKHGMQIHFYKAKTIDPVWSEQYVLTEISTDAHYTYFVIVTDDEEYNFPLKEVPEPRCDFTAIETQIAETQQGIQQQEERLSELKCHEAEIEQALADTLSKLDLHLANVSGQQAAEEYITIFEGFAPREQEPALRQMLDQENILYIVEKATINDNPPIKLKNNKFVSMFEVLTDMYGRPKYDEFDPTVFISIFFMLFFAFCMGDAGYGLVIILMSLALKKKMPKLAPLGVTLGVATTIIGFFFHTFFSTDMLMWHALPDAVKKCMLPPKIMGQDGTMVLAILVGIIHLCLAMIVKTYQSTKVKGFANSLSTWGWTLLIVGSVIVGGFSLIGVLNSVVTKWIIIALGILSVIGIFFLNNLHRNPLLNVGAGLWDTYNTATGLLGDVLSYLRLYALGLAGAKLGEAFNAIGLQALGDGGIGWIFFILIVLVGHTLNIAMCILGAFVHPLRLNFLEFFKNSGYVGSGRKYRPL